MLNQVRGKLKGAVAWIFVILLVAAFALFGVPEVNQMTGNAAVSVGGEKYSAQYVQSEYNRAMDRRRRESGSAFTQADAVASGLPDQVISSIVTTSATKQIGESMRLVVPRELVSAFLQQNESFQNRATNQFDETVLRSILQLNGITAVEFERRIAEDLMRTQLINALSAGGAAPTAFSESILLRDTERRRISYLIVTEEMAGIAAEPTPEGLQTYYEQNPAAFTAPEYRTYHLLELRAEDFREGQSVPEEEIKRIYDLNKARIYDVPETRTLYQLTLDSLTDAQAIIASLRQGEPFEKIAAERGRTLDSVTFTDIQKSQLLDPAVAEAAFHEELGEGGIADPVQSLFGWTVVQIANVNAPQTKLYEEVRDALEAEFLVNDTRRAMLNAIDQIEEERDIGTSLEVAADVADLSVITVGPSDQFGRTPDGETAQNSFDYALAEAFKLEEGEESEALEFEETDGYFLVSLLEITEPTLKPFDVVRDDVERLWRAQERAARIANTVSDIREAVKNGVSLATAAEPYNRAPIEILIDQRFEDEAISRSLNDQIFFAQLGTLVSGPAAFGNSQVIAEIHEIGYARNNVSPAEVNMFRQYIGYQLDQELLDAFVTEVRDSYGVKINRSQLDLVFGEIQ